jgi:hypothetical protein
MVRAEAPITVDPDCAVALAVTVVTQLLVPQLTEVASPEESMVATSVSLDAQVT